MAPKTYEQSPFGPSLQVIQAVSATWFRLRWSSLQTTPHTHFSNCSLCQSNASPAIHVLLRPKSREIDILQKGNHWNAPLTNRNVFGVGRCFCAQHFKLPTMPHADTMN